jgi:hypothetical protein
MMTSLITSGRPKIFAGLALVFGIYLAPSVQAKPEYPGYVRDHLQMACTPRCTLCHEVEVPTRSPEGKQPFFGGIGAIGEDRDTLIVRLDSFGDTDSDNDGMSDINELKDNNTGTAGPGIVQHLARDPNVSGPGDICASNVNYGCGSQMAKSPSFPGGLDALAIGALFGAALLFVRRRVRSASA